MYAENPTVETPIRDLANNCVLVAFQVVSKKPDRDILEAALKNGYEFHRGIFGTTIPGIGHDLGLKVVDRREKLDEARRIPTALGRVYSKKLPTLRKIASTFPKGVYLIGVEGHCLTLINGKIIDKNLPNADKARKVLQLYQLVQGSSSSKLLSHSEAWPAE